ncbi:MAG: alpha-amylase family glycosyl hydrolase [Chloroflexi bacterium]|nr:alpha-amylase family glycosyl hydrolase [Chloroflexota bacterium]MCY3582448.1 alpha-amylase family glycosyl hydrolase [Chloroflexota bacterium]MCY3717004.1 alpha-amylase family glycosyl hydrolase [Chloroflexota bacterium]MDE2652074.1 alpha-amylase family glycosyl hydrolase [Chloroflexota bacterium]MXV92039.1 alpha-amylase [Chloroflexota bacterium]
MDIIFGKLISDSLKLETHRALCSGIQHQHEIRPLDPGPDDPVAIHLTTANDLPIDSVWLRYSIDGSDPRAGNTPTVDFALVETAWDTVAWGYLSRWRASIPPQADGTLVRYCISGRQRNGELFHADYPSPEERTRHATMLHFGNIPASTPFTPSPQNEPPLFCYHIDRLRAPNWVKDAVIYHIFLDRFHPGAGKDWRQTEDLQGVCGGTLWGVRDKLDYIADLGATCLWLSPCWVSPSHHGYDIADYQRIEARLGGEAALDAVMEGAKKRGMRVLLDLAANHVSNEHPIFLDAFHSENSPYRAWFTFGERFPHGYKGFFNVKTMPEINLEHGDACEWMIENGEFNLRRFGVDGYRLDVAAGPGQNFWSQFRPRMRAINPECVLLGEIIDTPATLRSYTGRLDGCLDFSLTEALRNTYGWGSWDEEKLRAFITSHDRYFADDFLRPSFIDNHDMDRFSLIVNNDSGAMKRVATAQLSLPNPPIILYGTEVGLRQRQSARGRTLDVIREPMPWGERQDRDLLAFYKAAIQARKGDKA